MELEKHIEDQKANSEAYIKSSKLAEEFSNKLFKENYIGVMQANSVYLDVSKIVYEAMMRTYELKNE
tara:strand:+ start:66 stop:266 length:201 start_codon:yes stop_codon:yes gene_type:complete